MPPQRSRSFWEWVPASWLAIQHRSYLRLQRKCNLYSPGLRKNSAFDFRGVIIIASDRDFKIQCTFMKASNYYCHLSLHLSADASLSGLSLRLISYAWTGIEMNVWGSLNRGELSAFWVYSFKSALANGKQRWRWRDVAAVNYYARVRQLWLDWTQGDSFEHELLDSWVPLMNEFTMPFIKSNNSLRPSFLNGTTHAKVFWINLKSYRVVCLAATMSDEWVG